MKKFLVIGILFLSQFLFAQIPYGSNSKVGKRVQVGDISMYYEIYGKGEPLILLHGGYGSSEMMGGMIKAFSKKYQVIAVDSRSQGRTTDSDEKELTYAQMALDVNGFMDKLQIKKAKFVGWSDGGDIALELALIHPEKITKAVIMGANFLGESKGVFLGFDTRAFNRLIAVVGKSTWEVLNARKKVVAQWEQSPAKTETVAAWGRKSEETIPSGLESTEQHLKTMHEMQAKAAKVLRKDGNPEQAFANAKKVLERTYTAPFLAHNPMEPISCFAHITDEKAFFVAPIQIPEMMKQNILSNLDLKESQLEIQLARMGGGFGRRAYGHYIVEAGHISKHVKAPIKLIYTREDDMTNGVYRPSYLITYRAAIDENNQVTAIHVKGGGIPEGAIHENRFPAGAFENYLAEGWQIPSNITIGAFRAPGSNFNASAEQSFLDELAHTIGKDPIDFRIDLLKKAKANPVGKRNDYNADRYIGVLELVKQKAGWGKPEHAHKKRGVAAYFCHNSYAAQVVDLRMEKGQLVIDQVTSALDCGYVVNPEGAKNMAEGAVVDGVGNALFGGLVFEKGKPTTVNLNTYKIIRQVEAPKKIDVHFVKSDEKPTGLGEPPFPPVFAAVANALFQATGKRFYDQPYLRAKI